MAILNFPDPSYATSYDGPNGLKYIWDPSKQQWHLDCGLAPISGPIVKNETTSVTRLTFQNNSEIYTWSIGQNVAEVDIWGNKIGGTGTIFNIGGDTISLSRVEPGWSVGNYARNTTKNPFT